MKGLFIACVLALAASCSYERYSEKIEIIKNNIQLADSATVMRYAETITAVELKKHLYKYASNEF
ncbi:hypothetical protein [Bizionia argentinensis]|uniref:hypothetical protein n=1 Tax=Bizionia argentinensis TaxID=456455 RepID=UPI0002232257|nr:hypothetical protein [Bizionia argentinensis]